MTPEKAQDFTVFREITFIVYGMFLWDYLTTLWLELYLIWGKLKLRWPLIPYFLTRYSALGFVIGCILSQTSKQPLNCDALYLGGTLLGKVAVASASVNTLVRTVIIWSYRWYIVLLLGLVVSGEVILICLGVKSRRVFATWNDEVQCCTVSFNSGTSDLALFAPYALCVDCIIVSLTIIGLRKFDPKSGLANVLIRQGLSFFLLVLPFQTFVTAAVYSDGSEAFVSVSSVLCAVIVPMASCHMVRSILSGSYRFVWAHYRFDCASGLTGFAHSRSVLPDRVLLHKEVRPRTQDTVDETVFNSPPTLNWGVLRNDA